MTSFLRPRQLARSKRCRTEVVYQAIASGRLQTWTLPTQSGGRRFLISAGEAKRWKPSRKKPLSK